MSGLLPSLQPSHEKESQKVNTVSDKERRKATRHAVKEAKGSSG